MKEALLFLLGSFAVTALVGALSHTSLSSSVRTSLASITLALVILPLMSTEIDLGELKIPENSFESGDFDGYIEVSEGAFCDGIALALREEFALSYDEVRVECTDFDFSKMRASEIRIALFGEGAFADFRQIKSYVEDNFTDGGRCYIDGIFE